MKGWCCYMNFDALERLARQALARKSAHSPVITRTMQYALTGTERSALRSSRWQANARLGREEEGKPPVVADNPDMGGWF
jgi:hypothetical protein